MTQFTAACLCVIMGSHDSEDSQESWKVWYCKNLELSFPKNMSEMIQNLKGTWAIFAFVVFQDFDCDFERISKRDFESQLWLCH